MSRSSGVHFLGLALLAAGCGLTRPPARDGVAGPQPRLQANAREEPRPPEPRSSAGRGGARATETIDLPSALRLAGARSLDVQLIAERLSMAEADLDLATAKLLPSLLAGAAYSRHDGRLQETRGEVFDVSRSSLFAGPQLQLSADPAAAYFERLEALRLVDAAQHASERTHAEALLRSALLYLELVRARALIAVAREALDHSQAQVELSQRLVEAQAELRLVLLRAQAQEARDQQRLLAATSAAQRASIELAVWLRLPPEVELVPADTDVQPVTLVPEELEAGSLVDSALARRPELRELQALREAAEERQSAARWRPWLPRLDLAVQYGAFGGGRGSSFDAFGDRVDAGAALAWSFEGFGFADAARRRRAEADARQAALQLSGLEELIAGQVLGTFEELQSLRSRLVAARARVEAAQEARELAAASFQAGDAIQLEVLEAASVLAEARAELVAAVIEYNQAQHALHYQVYGSSRASGN
jgi:outer membrane protein TolC